MAGLPWSRGAAHPPHRCAGHRLPLEAARPRRDLMLTLPERLLLISIDDQGKPHDPKSSLGHALAGAALTERGLLAGGERRVLGLVPVAAHRVADPATAERARAAISEVLLGHQEPDERAAALIALVQV